jgi:MinD superfamily P-loop ATPase
MIISVASGKGGTGKTTVAVNLALSLGKAQLLDCDVEEPNAHLLLNPQIMETYPVQTLVPTVNEESCDHCGKCSEFCQYHALLVVKDMVLTFPELCHGCGGCSLVCPKRAIREVGREIGVVKRGNANGVDLVYGELRVSEPMATPLIREVKKRAATDRTVIVDAAPGTSCPVITAVHGSDFCLLVTEPTPFGLSNLHIMVQVLREIDIPLGVVVNFHGIGDSRVQDYCERARLPVLLQIPFNRRIAELYSRGIPFVAEMPVWRKRFRRLASSIGELVVT